MAERVLDLSNWLGINTAIYKNVPDLAGDMKNADGSERVWRVTPPSPATEEKLQRIQRANSDLLGEQVRFLKARWDQIQGVEPAEAEGPRAPIEEMDPVLLGQQYAPLLAAYVTNVTLDPDELAKDFSGFVIKFIVEDIQSFFGAMKERMSMLKTSLR